VVRSDFSYAIVFLNRRTDGTPSEVSVINRELGLTHEAGYIVEDLYTNKDYGILTPDDKITVDVNPSGNAKSCHIKYETLFHAHQIRSKVLQFCSI